MTNFTIKQFLPIDFSTTALALHLIALYWQRWVYSIAGADPEFLKGGRSMSATMVGWQKNFRFQMV